MKRLFNIIPKLSLPTVLGGGAPAWTPASPTTDGGSSPHTWHIPGLDNYQDSGKTTASAVDQPVGASVNQGSDTHDIVQATAVNRPTLRQVTNNGKTFYTWEHNSDYLKGAFGGGAISQPFTAIYVAKLDPTVVNDGQNHFATDGDDATNRMILSQLNTPTPDAWQVLAGASLVDGDTDSNWNIFTILYNGASSQLWINGTSKASGDVGAHTPDGITIGANNGGGAPWKGYLAPLLIYPGNISNADKNQIGQYLFSISGISYTDIP